MKKKLISLLCMVAITAAMIAGCGSSGEPANNQEDQGNQTDVPETGEESSGVEESSADNSDGETPKVIMTYLTTGTTPSDLLEVQDAINAISKEKINVEVELKPVSIGDTFSGQYSLWIGSGEQIDLMCIAFQGLTSYISSGQLLELNDLLASDGQELEALSAEAPLFTGAEYDEKVYGVTPIMPSYGYQGGIILRKDYFEELGIQEKDLYTREEITDIMAAIKTAYPDTYPACILGSGITSSISTAGFFMEYDTLGATMKSGVLTGYESTEIVNLFEQQEYLQFLKMMRQWYEAGYIMPDAATTDALSTELMVSGKCSSFPMNIQPVQLSTEASYGFESVALPMTDGYYPSVASSSATFWTIPITSGNPQAAMKFLSLLYEDVEIAHLLKDGIEGKHYVKTETEGVVAFPEGVTMENTGYFNALGIYGDRREEYFWNDSVTKAQNDAWTAQNKQKIYQSFGYNYDSANVENELIAIATVLDQYLPSLETGSVADVEGTYQQMLDGLKAAGIDKVIEDNQAQFDAWLAEQ